MLKFHPAWRFDSPGEIPNGVSDAFFDLIGKTASQGDRQDIIEHFKRFFAKAAGITSGRSSNLSWAESDLRDHMNRAAENAPLFIEAFVDACESLQQRFPDFGVPDVNRINRILAEKSSGYQIEPPNLISNSAQTSISVTAAVSSLDDQAQELIQKSLSDSEKLLSEGRGRQAVQELLWLLETVATAFQGLDTGTGTVQGKYFNKIAVELRDHHKGKTTEQIIRWVTTLHGYLSSPSGGGVRHGTDLQSGFDMQPHEARLLCNLIRSYSYFLLEEYQRLKGL